MKRKLHHLYLLLFCIPAFAQTLDIPDVNLKNALLTDFNVQDAEGNYVDIDLNNDNEIQQSEALLAYTIDVAGQEISSMQGIEHFTNLVKLYCDSNNLTTLDVTALTNLQELNCGHNNLTSLTITNLPNLYYLVCVYNELENIDFSGVISLAEVHCDYNNLQSIDLTPLIHLNALYCMFNALQEIDLSTNSELEYLVCAHNNISALDLTPVPLLEGLSIEYNEFTEIDLTVLPDLRGFGCTSNAISELDLSMNNELQVLYCSLNNLSTLDLSQTKVYSASFAQNNISYVNLKNGIVHSTVTDLENAWGGNPLQTVCADEDEVSVVAELLTFSDYIDVNLTTYCSFSPGGDYNTILGTLSFDEDNNGCDGSDPVSMFLKVALTDGETTRYSFANNGGNYLFYTQEGDFTVTPQFEEDYFSATPGYGLVNFPVVDNSLAVQDFCVTANGDHPDIEVVMEPVTPAQPGFNAVYKIVYKNKGNSVLSGTVGCQWDPSLFTLIDLIPGADYNEQGNYGWNFADLKPFENREVMMVLNVNSPTDSPAVNIDDILAFTATAVVDTDTYPADNNFQLNQVVVGSYSANNIMCIQGETAPPSAIGDYLHYVVNFENTGNAPSNSVVVRHQLNPAQFDISTIELLNSSHDVTASINGDVIEFIFQNINLQAAGHGNILFKVKTRPSVMANETVTNTAEIFFDYNAPVFTNEANTTFITLNTDVNEIDNSVRLYPNPAGGMVTVKADSTIKVMELYDVQGRLLFAGTGETLDVSSKQAGIYLVKVVTDKGIYIEKLVKE